MIFFIVFLLVFNIIFIYLFFKTKRKLNRAIFDNVNLLVKCGKEKEQINPENICYKLYKNVKLSKNPLKEIFDRQTEFQKKYAGFKQEMSLKERLKWIDKNWRNLCIEYGEMMLRLPYKEWKNYNDEDFVFGGKEKLEVYYEFIDIAHFFINIGIYLGIDWRMFYNLYITKNKENFDRQKRNY